MKFERGFYRGHTHCLLAERAASARKMKELLEGLVGRVPGLLSAGVHQNFTPGGYDLCLVS